MATLGTWQDRDTEPIRFALWEAHKASLEGLAEARTLLAGRYAAPELAFFDGWVRMVDFLAAAAWRTDIEFMRSNALDALPERMTVFIEVKAGSLIYPGIEPDLVALLQQHKAKSRVQVSSFDHQALQRVHQLAPDLPLGMLTGDNRLDPVGDARAIGASAIHPLFIWVTPMLIEAAHAAGLQVNAWTINEPPFIAMYRAMGIDGIMSDFPERF